eukprot:COSAG01_NODE_1511_length_10068_cov_7.643731_4_plen_214_part_00
MISRGLAQQSSPWSASPSPAAAARQVALPPELAPLRLTHLQTEAELRAVFDTLLPTGLTPADADGRRSWQPPPLGGGGSGDGGGGPECFGLAGAEKLLRDAGVAASAAAVQPAVATAAVVAAEPVEAGRACACSRRHADREGSAGSRRGLGGLSAAELVVVLDDDGDGVVSWPDFKQTVGRAAEQVGWWGAAGGGRLVRVRVEIMGLIMIRTD